MQKIVGQLANEIKIRPEQVRAVVDLIDGGATVPFIARYRKEATGGLDDIQLRELEARLAYLRELETCSTAVIKSIEEQGKLTPELRAALDAEMLDVKLISPEPPTQPDAKPEPSKVSLAEGKIALYLGWSHKGRSGDDLIRKCVAWT